MIWRFFRGLLKVVAAIVIFVAVAAVVAIVLLEWNCRPAGEVRAEMAPLVDDAGYKRTEANTYWTFPEWYIVYSFEDFGAFLDSQPESAFPYASQIAGFWQSACAANRVASGLPGDHYEVKQMIYVIGLSYTFELGILGAYENTIGRLTEWLRGPKPTAEDIYARQVTQEYGAFLHQVPWYEFPFMEKLDGLWKVAPQAGDNPFRATERRLSLSAQYLAKAGYAKAIGALVGFTEPAPLEVMFVARGNVAGLLVAEPEVRQLRVLPDGGALLVAPRYRAFTDMLKRNTGTGVEVIEIAGNRHILMTAIVPEGGKPSSSGIDEMFVVPVDARPGFVRIGYDVDVPTLMATLAGFQAQGVEVEHLYDY